MVVVSNKVPDSVVIIEDKLKNEEVIDVGLIQIAQRSITAAINSRYSWSS